MCLERRMHRPRRSLARFARHKSVRHISSHRTRVKQTLRIKPQSSCWKTGSRILLSHASGAELRPIATHFDFQKISPCLTGPRPGRTERRVACKLERDDYSTLALRCDLLTGPSPWADAFRIDRLPVQERQGKARNGTSIKYASIEPGSVSSALIR